MASINSFPQFLSLGDFSSQQSASICVKVRKFTVQVFLPLPGCQADMKKWRLCRQASPIWDQSDLQSLRGRNAEVLALKNKYIFITIYIYVKSLPQSHRSPDRIFLLNCAKRIIEVVWKATAEVWSLFNFSQPYRHFLLMPKLYYLKKTQ